MSRLDDVITRLKEFERLRKISKGKKYLEDLDLSIQGCKNELKFLDKNPHGVEFVNGA